LRPLLSVWKTELRQFAKRSRLRFREDATNAESLYTRNRIRNLLIPEIENILGRPVKRNLLRLTEIAREEEKLINALTPDIWKGESILVHELRAQPVALQRRIIRQWLSRLVIPDIGFEEVESVRALAERDKPAKTNLPQDHFCRRKEGRLFLEQKQKG
jgi:tRNA(Ile)-lysidine synthase